MTQPANFKKAIFHGTIWSLIDNFSRQMITLLVFIVLARMLPPALFGLLATSILIVQGFKSIAFDSIGTALVRKLQPSDLDYDTAFWMCVALSIPSFLIMYGIAGYVERWTGADGLGGVMRGVSLIVLTSGLCRIHEARLTHEMSFRPLAIRSFFSVLAGGTVGIGMAMRGYGIESLIAQQVVTSICEFMLLWAISKWKPSFRFSKASCIEIVHFSKHVATTAGTNFANQNSDIFFVTYFLGSAAAGFYATGKRITNTLNIVISTALLRVSLPTFSRLQEDEAELQKTYLHSTALTAMLTAPMFVGLAVLSHDVVLLLLGEKWLPSVPVMQVITVVGFLTSIGYYNQSIMLVKNKPQWQARLTLLYAVTNLIAFFLFTRFGLVYTALAFATRAVLLFPISVWCALTLLSVRWKDYLRAILPALFSSLVMAITIFFVAEFISALPVILKLVVLIFVGAVVYAAVLYFVMAQQYRNIFMTFVHRYV